MTRRKREMVGLTNERDFPHLVELAFAAGGFRSVFLEIDAFHRERRIPVRRGRSRHELEQLYIRFCFLDAFTADAFSNRFGGQCLTYAPGKPNLAGCIGREARGRDGVTTTFRTHFTFRVDTWTPDGESIVEHVAGVEDYQVALATYRAACEHWPGTPITLRQGARVIEDSRRLRVVSSQ